MPALLGFLHIAVAIFFAVHAVRHGRNNYLLFILLAFPFLGSVVYFFAEYLPEVRDTRVARKAVGAVTALVDPGRDLRAARADYERTPSVEHRARLADALLAAGNAGEAVEHFRQCVTGHYAKDAKLRAGLARALFAAGQPRAAADAPERYAGANALLLARVAGRGWFDMWRFYAAIGIVWLRFGRAESAKTLARFSKYAVPSRAASAHRPAAAATARRSACARSWLRPRPCRRC